MDIPNLFDQIPIAGLFGFTFYKKIEKIFLL